MVDQNRRPPDRSHEQEDQKPGAPPRPAAEPNGGGVAHRQDKTHTDPATGSDRGHPGESEKI